MVYPDTNCQDELQLDDADMQRNACSIEKKGLLWFAIIGLILIFYAINPFLFQPTRGELADSSRRHRFSTFDNGLKICDIKWRHKKIKVDVYEPAGKCYRQLSTNVTSSRFIQSLPKLVNATPVFKLDRNRFIIPILDGGPNNQIFELRETIFLAIKLNRTLVIPRFFKHFTDSQDKAHHYIYPGHRVSLASLCGFVSCITLNKFQSTCHGKVDGVISAAGKIVSRKDAEAIELYLGMRILRTKLGDPILERLFHTFQSKHLDKFVSDAVTRTLESKIRCVLQFKPLFNIIMPTINNRGKKIYVSPLKALEDNITTTADTHLFTEITKHTQHPEHIRNLATAFIKYVVGNESIAAAHWRFNKGDYLRRCFGLLHRNTTGPKGKIRFCKATLSMTPQNIAKSIQTKINDISTKIKELHAISPQLRHIYIASPLNENATTEVIRRYLKNSEGWVVHSSDELRKFISKSFAKCKFMKIHINDIISTTEMEICSKGFVFLKSPRSTWSSNVRLSRMIDPRQGTFPNFDCDII